MKKRFRILPFVLAILFVISMIPCVFADDPVPNIWTPSGKKVSDLGVRLYVTFKDSDTDKPIKGVKITGNYTYHWVDKNGAIQLAVNGVTILGKDNKDYLKSDSSGEIVHNLNEYGHVIHYDSGDYSEIPVHFTVTPPSGYTINKTDYSYKASYKTCVERKNASGKIIGYDLKKTIYLTKETVSSVQSYPLTVQVNFKDQDNKAVSGVEIKGTYSFHYCNASGETTYAINGIAPIGDEFNEGTNRLLSNANGVISFKADAFGGLSYNPNSSDTTYSEIPMGFDICPPSGYTISEDHVNYKVNYKNATEVKDSSGKLTGYKYTATIKLTKEEATTITSYPAKMRLVFKDQNGNAVQGVKIQGSYGYRTCDKNGNVLMVIKGIHPFGDPEVDGVVASDAAGIIEMDVSSFGNLISCSD